MITSALPPSKSVSIIFSLQELTHILAAQKILLAHVSKDPSQAAAFIRRAYVVSIGQLEDAVNQMQAAATILEGGN